MRRSLGDGVENRAAQKFSSLLPNQDEVFSTIRFYAKMTNICKRPVAVDLLPVPVVFSVNKAGFDVLVAVEYDQSMLLLMHSTFH